MRCKSIKNLFCARVCENAEQVFPIRGDGNLKKNDIFETEIMDMTTEGSGVCRVDNMAVFVPHTAVGDRIRVRIVKVLKSYAFGIVEELLEPSAEPHCACLRFIPVRRLSVSAYHV